MNVSVRALGVSEATNTSPAVLAPGTSSQISSTLLPKPRCVQLKCSLLHARISQARLRVPVTPARRAKECGRGCCAVTLSPCHGQPAERHVCGA